MKAYIQHRLQIFKADNFEIFRVVVSEILTTVNLIGSASLALMEHPDQLAKLRSEPALVKTAIEELVRFVCPVEMATERYAREDIMIAETTIPHGELVMAVLGSANRDAYYFDNPDSLDITRKNNKHLAFGHSAHYCLVLHWPDLKGKSP